MQESMPKKKIKAKRRESTKEPSLALVQNPTGNANETRQVPTSVQLSFSVKDLIIKVHERRGGYSAKWSLGWTAAQTKGSLNLHNCIRENDA